jgi:predicted nucleic-acid-binding protein
MIAIDTNVLLRFLFKPVDNKNPKWQVDVAEALINKADKVFISSIVIAETEWVLESVFECNRQEIYLVIHELVSNSKFQLDDWSDLNNALLDYIGYQLKLGQMTFRERRAPARQGIVKPITDYW